jgi:serine/threonine protein kinase
LLLASWGCLAALHGGILMAVAGQTLGQYDIIREIGRGGMATVYLARQVSLDREVALKELSTFYAASPEMVQRFLRESRLAGALNHPNIVTVHEYFEADGLPYIAMEYLPRGSLRPYVGRLSMAQIVGVLEGVLAGLAHAASFGIVHRDLKPENLMLTADGRIKIADFGIAKATQSAGTEAFLTAAGTTVGTPTYMAPEQAMGQSEDIGVWGDLYSTGVMAWEHVVGYVPFRDTTAPMAILIRQVNEVIPGAATVAENADPDLSEWIDRLLVKDYHKRAQDPSAAWDELEEMVLGKIGPRWRREARLPTESAVLLTPRPLTPAPFTSQRARTPPPTDGGALQPPKRTETGYVTFGCPPGTEQPVPEAAPPEQPVAQAQSAEDPVSEAQPADRPAAEIAPSRTVPEAPPPDRPSEIGAPTARPPAPPPRSIVRPAPETGYVTFGKPPQPVAEAAAEARNAPAQPEAPPVEAEAAPPPPVRPKVEEVSAPEPTESAAEPVPTPELVPVVEPRSEPEPEAARPHQRTRFNARMAAALIAGVAAAAVAGFLIAPSSRSPAPGMSHVSSGPIWVSIPAGWQRRAAPETRYVTLANPVAVQPAKSSEGTLLLGTAPTTDPTLLPDKLLKALSAAPSPNVVTLGKDQFYRYVALSPAGSVAPLDVYALPTTAGTVIGLCTLQGAGAGFPGECERVLSSLRLGSGTILGLGPSASLAASLRSAIRKLNAAVAAGGARLQVASKPADQAKAANQLAAAHAKAASAVHDLKQHPAAVSATSALARALASVGRDYAALGRAAAGNNGKAYGIARTALAKDQLAVRAAFGRLEQLGYVGG